MADGRPFEDHLEERTMMDVVFLMIAIVFVLAAFVFGIATLSQSPTVRSAAYKAIYGTGDADWGRLFVAVRDHPAASRSFSPRTFGSRSIT
jgi:hypothetical protein